MRTLFLEGISGHDKHVNIVRVMMDGELVYDAVHDAPDALSSWKAVAQCCGWNGEGSPRTYVESTFGALDPTTNNYIIDCVPLIILGVSTESANVKSEPEDLPNVQGDQTPGS